jgi:DNA-binding FrmR family transcriptional regulator
MDQPGVDASGLCAHEEALTRLRLAHGQLGGVINMVETQRDCEQVLTQLAAVLHALHRASFRLVAAELERSVSSAPGRRTTTRTELEKLFVALG